MTSASQRTPSANPPTHPQRAIAQSSRASEQYKRKGWNSMKWTTGPKEKGIVEATPNPGGCACGSGGGVATVASRSCRSSGAWGEELFGSVAQRDLVRLAVGVPDDLHTHAVSTQSADGAVSFATSERSRKKCHRVEHLTTRSRHLTARSRHLTTWSRHLTTWSRGYSQFR
jgi:hypothetical protein